MFSTGERIFSHLIHLGGAKTGDDRVREDDKLFCSVTNPPPVLLRIEIAENKQYDLI